MSEIEKPVSATQAEFIRQELAATMFFAMPAKDADDDARFQSYQRVKQLLHIADMLNGKEPDFPSCEGCGKAMAMKERYFAYSDESDTMYFCEACNLDGENQTGELAHNPAEADRDIEKARAFVDDYISDPPMTCEECGHTETDPIMLDVETCSQCGGMLKQSEGDGDHD